MTAILNKTSKTDGCVFAADECSVDIVNCCICRAPVVAAAEDGHVCGAVAARYMPVWVMFEVVQVVSPDRE